MAVGDIALVRYTADGTAKPFSFVILADLSGRTISFTDNGWLAAGGFRANEGTITYVVPANTPIGTVVSLNITGSFNPSGTGDQILAYLGTSAAPDFLFAVDFGDGNATYAGDATNSNTSAVPPGLTFGTTALAFAADNAAYAGPLSGTREQILANIADESLWTQDDAAQVAAPDTFTVISAGGVSVSIGDVSIAEGDAGTSIATFTVTRSDDTTDFSIDYATANGTANLADYDASAGTLTFVAGGALTQTISVTINGDTAIEPTETFTVALSNVVQTTGSTTIGDGTATGTIVNDDIRIIGIHDVQGSAFFSPILAAEGITAFNQASANDVTVRGVVAAIDTIGTVQGFYISEETSDWDMSALTSEGIFVRTTSATGGLTVGETVTVTARVTEYQDFTNLNRTMLTTPSAITQENDSVALPTFIIDGTPGRRIPTAIISDDSPNFRDSDGSSGTFDPQNDALDFYETIEGMRVTMTNMIVGDGFVSGSNNDFVFFNAYSADNADATLINSRGGYTVSGDPEFYPVDTANPDDDVKFGGATVHDGASHGDIVELDFSNVGRGGTSGFDQLLTMGDSLGDVSGILDSDFNAIKLYVTDALDADKVALLGATTPIQEVTALQGDDRSLRVASFNVENLSPVGTTFSTNTGVEITTQEKFDKLAANIADNLRAPDIIIIEEVQDNNGVTQNSVTDASTTFEQLIAAVNAATGKVYQWVDEAPEVSGTVGGAPGGNIRVGFLYDTARVQLGDLAADASLEDRRKYTDRIGDNQRDAGDLIAIDDSQVAGIDPTDWAGTRRSIVGEFTFNGQTVYAFGSHLPSKGGSGDPYQLNQNNAAGQPANGGWADRNTLAQDIWAVQNLVSTTQTEAKLVAGGDFNEFWYNRPLEVLTGYANPDGTANTSGTNYVNLMVQELVAAERFSYDFDGRSQALDTIISDQALAAVASYDVVHINTGYNERDGAVNPASSDHDPGIASFDFRDFDETLAGSGADDSISGFGGDDALSGLGGDDILQGGEGDDRMNGGTGGSDTASYASSVAGVTVSLELAGPQDTIGAGTDTLIGFENLIGSAAADVLTGDAGSNRFVGNGGRDTISGMDGDDRIAIESAPRLLDGGAGNDLLTIQSGSVVIAEGMITGFESIRVNGGAELDLSQVLATVAPIRSFGTQQLTATITGTQGNDLIYGGRGADDLAGEGGNDTIFLTNNPARIDGGAGNDRIIVAGGVVMLDEVSVSGIERVEVRNGGTADLSGFSISFASLSLNTTAGKSGAIVGTMANDRIAGGAGNDRIDGGSGADRLSGGTGSDVFAFSALDDLDSNGVHDLIGDFSRAGGDLIDLSAIDADLDRAGQQRLTFIGTDRFSGTGADDYEVRVQQSANGNTVIQFDTDQDGLTDRSIAVHSDTALVRSDFVLADESVPAEDAASSTQNAPVQPETMAFTDVADRAFSPAQNAGFEGPGFAGHGIDLGYWISPHDMMIAHMNMV